MKSKIGGIYEHYKKEKYIVYGIVNDCVGKEYVLYKGINEDTYWIRPKENFFEVIEHENAMVKRFTFKEKIKEDDYEDYLNKLKEELTKEKFFITHTENGKSYMIIEFSYKDDLSIKIHEKYNESSVGFLSDFDLLCRMNLLYIKVDNKDIKYNIDSICENQKLSIEYQESTVKYSAREKVMEYINPCSIDLHISDFYFRSTTSKNIDLLNFNNYNKASSLWKRKKVKNFNNNNFFIIYPNEIIITRTYEKIKIPHDCVGKIEIRSTYARLGLSVTYSDFCNPGWCGYFPLQIKNNSTHKIILHPEEDMLQLSLISLKSYPQKSYESNASYLNDDGTAESFWNSKTLKHLKEKNGDYIFFSKYRNLSLSYEGSMKERFDDTFLQYCQKNKNKNKFKNNEGRINIKPLYDSYIKKELTLNRFLAKWKPIVYSLLPSISSIGLFFIKLDIKIVWKFVICLSLFILTIVGIFLSIKYIPETFCTKKFDINNLKMKSEEEK